MSNAAIVDIGSHLTRLALQVGLPVKSLVKQTIYGHFCGGESLEETIPTIDRLAEAGVSTILDYGVEAKEDEAELTWPWKNNFGPFVLPTKTRMCPI